MRKLILSVFFYLLSVPTFAVTDPDFVCDNGTVTGAWKLTVCSAKRASQYTPLGANWDYPAKYIAPANPTQPLTIQMKFDGYSPTSLGGNAVPDPAPDKIIAGTVYGHYPDENLWRVGNAVPWDWGGAFMGANSNSMRYAATLEAIANSPYAFNIDWGKGAILQGTCYGGSAAVLQSMMLPNNWSYGGAPGRDWQQEVSIVYASLAGLMFVNDSTVAPPNGGHLYTGGPNARLSWEGYDLSQADMTQNLHKLKNIYFRLSPLSHPQVDGVNSNLAMFTKVCDAGRIACYGQWHDSGHDPIDHKAPLAYRNTYFALFGSPDMDWRLDSMKVIFTKSSANYMGPGLRGHYNLGLHYNMKNSTAWVDTATAVSVPIRYVAMTDMGVGLPDQPATATFDVTVRPMNFPLNIGDTITWSFAGLNGTVTVDEAGEITIPQLTLPSNVTYTNLGLINSNNPGC